MNNQAVINFIKWRISRAANKKPPLLLPSWCCSKTCSVFCIPARVLIVSFQNHGRKISQPCCRLHLGWHPRRWPLVRRAENQCNDHRRVCYAIPGSWSYEIPRPWPRRALPMVPLMSEPWWIMGNRTQLRRWRLHYHRSLLALKILGVSTKIPAMQQACSFIRSVGGVARVRYARRKCVEWILEHQEATGYWAGILPPMHVGLLAPSLEGFSLTDSYIIHSLEAVIRFA